MGVDIKPLSFQGSWATGLGPSPLFTPVCWADMIIFNMIKVVKPGTQRGSQVSLVTPGDCGMVSTTGQEMR